MYYHQRQVFVHSLDISLCETSSVQDLPEVDVTVARRILFMPRASDARVYARIFAAPEEGKEGARMVQHASSLLSALHYRMEDGLLHIIRAANKSSESLLPSW